jgi:ribosome-interacting GTPase 1
MDNELSISNIELDKKVNKLDVEVKLLKQSQINMEESQKNMQLTLDTIKDQLRDRSIKDAETHGVVKVIENTVNNVQEQMKTMNDTVLKAALGEKEDADKAFYKRVIMISLAVIITLTLAAFGIKTLVSLPL